MIEHTESNLPSCLSPKGLSRDGHKQSAISLVRALKNIIECLEQCEPDDEDQNRVAIDDAKTMLEAVL